MLCWCFIGWMQTDLSLYQAQGRETIHWKFKILTQKLYSVKTFNEVLSVNLFYEIHFDQFRVGIRKRKEKNLLQQTMHWKTNLLMQELANTQYGYWMNHNIASIRWKKMLCHGTIRWKKVTQRSIFFLFWSS
jgi:hypothetical protein